MQCKLESFQLKNYNLTLNNSNDPLDRASSSAANFIFPGLDKNKKELNGYHSTEGLNILLSQINTDKNKLLKLINKKIFKNKLKSEILQNFIKETDNKNLTGNILHIDYLNIFH